MNKVHKFEKKPRRTIMFSSFSKIGRRDEVLLEIESTLITVPKTSPDVSTRSRKRSYIGVP